MPTDLAMTNEGELVVSANGDLMLATGDDQVAQNALFRLKTTRGDWTLSPTVGASLERFIGQPNTEQTHQAIEIVVTQELEATGTIPISSVDVLPTDENTVLIVVEFNSIEDLGRILVLIASLDLRKGLVFARTDYRET